MQIKKLFVLAALSVAAAAASATTVTNWGALGPVEKDVHANTYVPGAVDDVYEFSLGDYSDVPSTANYYQATSLSGVMTVDLTDAQVALYSGTYGSASDKLVADYSFGTAMTPHTFAGLTSGSYFFEVTGTAGTEGSDYYFDVEANSTTPPLSAVPEPANASLILAAFGIFGTAVARRRRN
jgi:PEP-CTERM motif